MEQQQKPGPLAGLVVIEMAGLGPAPFAALMLAKSVRVSAIQRAGRSLLCRRRCNSISPAMAAIP